MWGYGYGGYGGYGGWGYGGWYWKAMIEMIHVWLSDMINSIANILKWPFDFGLIISLSLGLLE